MTVRSTKLFAIQTVHPGYVVAYTCPTGWRTILKSFVLDNAGLPAGNFTVIVQDVSQSHNLNLFTGPVNSNAQYTWSGWLVMNPGDLVVLIADNAAAEVWASGTLLQLTGLEPM